jgi:hypothetical protein
MCCMSILELLARYRERCAAILYRFTNAGDREREEPLTRLFSRPLRRSAM